MEKKMKDMFNSKDRSRDILNDFFVVFVISFSLSFKFFQNRKRAKWSIEEILTPSSPFPSHVKYQIKHTKI